MWKPSPTIPRSSLCCSFQNCLQKHVAAESHGKQKLEISNTKSAIYHRIYLQKQPSLQRCKKKNINLTKNTGRDTSSYYWETFCQFRATGVNDCHQELSSKQNERNASTSKLLFELFELFEQQDTG